MIDFATPSTATPSAPRAKRRHGTPRDPTIISDQKLQASFDREDAIREARRAQPVRRSSSDFAPRCATCGQWPIRDESGLCRGGDSGYGHPYEPSALTGLAVVR